MISSRARSISDAVRLYATTFFAFFFRKAQFSESQEPAAAGLMGPTAFYLSSFAIVTVMEKLLFADRRGLELPPVLEWLSPVLEVIPEFTVAFSLFALVFQTTCHWLCFKLCRYPVGFSEHFRTMLYVSGVALVSLNMLLLPVMAALPQFAPSNLLLAAGTVVVALGYLFGSSYWVASHITTHHGSGRTLRLVALILLANMVMSSALEVSRVRPNESFWVPSSSMSPTLAPGDVLMVNRWVYKWREPYRGEVVTFTKGAVSVLPSLNPPVVWVKRIVGLPGDRMFMRDGRLHINGVQVVQTALPDHIVFVDHSRVLGGHPRCANAPVRSGEDCIKFQFLETLPNGVSHRVLDVGMQFSDNTAEYTVPDGFYFVMGDNRDNSNDSRMAPSSGGIGFVSRDYLIGPVYRIMVPSNKVFDFPTPSSAAQ